MKIRVELIIPIIGILVISIVGQNVHSKVLNTNLLGFSIPPDGDSELPMKKSKKKAKIISYPTPISPEVQIGNQVWMTRNLDVTKFRNGDPIPQAKSYSEWEKARNKRQPAWCYVNDDKRNTATCGVMYNWYAVVDSRGLAPNGWHIPRKKEWEVLLEFIMNDSTGQRLDDIYYDFTEKLRSKKGYYVGGHVDENGSDIYGFSAFPCGFRDEAGGFNHLNKESYFWLFSDSTLKEGKEYWDYTQDKNGYSVAGGERSKQYKIQDSCVSLPTWGPTLGYKGNGYSVRCIKD
jgi:uncharacterized protein (TIGR02145 family)